MPNRKIGIGPFSTIVTEILNLRDSSQEDGTLSGGMIPKINCCLNALREGVDKVTIVDGRVENCLLLELLTDQGIGTEIVK